MREDLQGRRYFESPRLIREALARPFARLGVRPWFVDAGLDFAPPPDSPVIDVVLMGNFAFQLSQVHFWPECRYRFWVLSQASRRVLSELYGLPTRSVRVIPRGLILPAAPVRRSPKADPRTPWVYSGRFSESKNFRLLLHFLAELQKQTGHAFPVRLLGDYDGYGKEDLGHPERPTMAYRREIQSLVKSLPWLRKPELITGLGPGEWLHHVPQNSVGISLSTHMKEDFGYSLAQLQARGIPLLVSNWGGHRDLAPGASLLAVNPSAARNPHRYARTLVNHFLRQKVLPSQASVDEWSLPDPLSWSRLLEARRKTLLRWPNLSHVTGAKAFIRFARQGGGRAFFAAYRDLFAGSH